MRFESKYKLGQRLAVEIDGGDGFGTITAIYIRQNSGELKPHINYELDGEWSYKGETWSKPLIRTEEELDGKN